MTLKKNSKKILDAYAEQGQRNAAQAYRDIHPNASDVTARTNAYKLLRKPEAQIYLQEHITNARNSIVELSTKAKNENTRLNASQDILDREYGKATQKTDTTSVTVTIDTVLEQLQ